MLVGVLLHNDRGVSEYWWGCRYIMVKVSLFISRGVSVYYWGYLCVLVGV